MWNVFNLPVIPKVYSSSGFRQCCGIGLSIIFAKNSADIAVGCLCHSIGGNLNYVLTVDLGLRDKKIVLKI